jgi:hypothetical protein
MIIPDPTGLDLGAGEGEDEDEDEEAEDEINAERKGVEAFLKLKNGFFSLIPLLKSFPFFGWLLPEGIGV